MSIEWGKQAWDEVSSDTDIKCFKRTGLYPEAEVEEDEDTLLKAKNCHACNFW